MEIPIPEGPSCTSNASAGLIDAETFDFNLSVSPGSQRGSGNETPEEVLTTNHVVIGQEDDDEVYLGPVSYKEQCVATRVDLVENPLEGALTAEQYVELFKEANAIALQIGEGGQERKESENDSKTLNNVAMDRIAKAENKLDLSIELNISVSKDTDAGIGNENDGLSVIERYRRLTKKNARSPRRGTYTVDKKQVQAAAALNKSQPVQARPTRLKKIPGGRIKRPSGKVEKAKSTELRKPHLLKPSPPSSGIPNPRTAPVDPTRPLPVDPTKPLPVDPTKPPLVDPTKPPVVNPTKLSDENTQDVLDCSASSSSSNSSVSSIPCLRKPNSTQRQRLSKLKPPKPKQELAGPKKRSPGLPQPTKEKVADSQQKKIPTSKLSLLKPPAMTTRSSGLAKPKPVSAAQKSTPPQKRKSQPMKATLTLEKTTKLNEEPSENGRRHSLRRPSTPCTPRGQEKSILPRKRILSSASTCSARTISRTSSSELDSSVPSTPGGNRRRSFLPTPAKATPARRRSALPTPSKMSPRSTRASRGSSMSSLRSSSILDESPPVKKPAVLREIQSDVFSMDSPNMKTSTPDLKPIKVSAIKKAKKVSKSPAVGMLVNFDDVQTETEPTNPFMEVGMFTTDTKENLIDF